MHLSFLSLKLFFIQNPDRFFQRIKEDTGVDFMSGTGGSRGRLSGGGSAMTPFANSETYGLSPSFLSQLGIEPPLTNKIFFANVSVV